jgi:hypothetical protein
MTNLIRWVAVTVLVGHGLIHLLGVAKGFGLAETSPLKQPISTSGGVVWLVAAGLVLAAAVLIATGATPWWWAVAILGAAISQVAITSSWSDAKFGTAGNVILVVAAVYGFASLGPTSMHAQWREQAAAALADVQGTPQSLVTERDLAQLPEPLAAYVRRSGAVGKPRVTSFAARFHGRIRSGPDQAWMPFTGQQLNTYGARPRRVFIMDATRSGLPVTVLHSFKDTTATMRAKVLSLVTVVDASGPEMDRGETVTVFNDLVVLAPGALVDAPVRWTALDAHHVCGVFTTADQTVSAELTFDADHDLIDFVSEDRLRASTDGKTFQRQPWSTPLAEHRDSDGRRILTFGEGRWQAPQPEGLLTYVEFRLDDITYNVHDLDEVQGQ